MQAVRAHLGIPGHGHLTDQQTKRFRKGTQKWFTARLLRHDGYNVECRLRRRLQRWRLPDLPGRTARRMARQLCRLKKLVPPRVCAATLSTTFNRWTTDRRMRSIRGTRRTCVLGCSRTADDSVEHYMHCPIGRAWAEARMARPRSQTDLARGLLAENMTDDELVRQAVFTYVLYRTVNHVRRLTFADDGGRQTFCRQYMGQMLHEATRDDPRVRNRCQPRVPGGPGRRRRADEGPWERHVARRTTPSE